MSGQAGTASGMPPFPKPDGWVGSRHPPHLSKAPGEEGIMAPVLCVRKRRRGLTCVLPPHLHVSQVTERFVFTPQRRE